MSVLSSVRRPDRRRSDALNLWATTATLILASTTLISHAMAQGAPAVDLSAPLIAPASSVPAAPAPPKGLSENVAAIVNDEVISSYDLRQRMRLLVATSGVQPTADNLPQIEREALRSLVDEHLEMQEVRDIQKKQKDLHLEPSDKEIDETIGDMAKQAGLKREQLLQTLRADDVDINTLHEQLHARLAWERYIGARFRDSVQVADNQVKAAYAQANLAAAKPQYLVSEIFIDASQVGSEQAAMSGAEQLVAQVQQGAPFASVARQFSALPTAANGGDAGWISGTDLQPELRTALEEMRPGQLSKPIPMAKGVYILALRDRRASAVDLVVDLKQAAVTLPSTASPTEVQAAETKLDALRTKITGCDTLESAAAKSPGVMAADLGETEVKELRPSFQQAIARLEVGQVSEPVRTDAGLHLIAVCERHASGARAITRADIEDKLKGEQFDMFARRFLRDIRNSATIETR